MSTLTASPAVKKIVSIGDLSRLSIPEDCPYAGALSRIKNEARGIGVTINLDSFYSEVPIELHNFSSSLRYRFIALHGEKRIAYYIEDRDFYSCNYVEVSYDGTSLLTFSDTILSKPDKSKSDIENILRAYHTLGIFQPFASKLL